MMRQI